MKWLFFAVSVAYGYECISVPQFGHIEVIAKDFTGAILKNPEVGLTEIGSKQSFDIAKPVPYGTYVLRVGVPGFKYLRREINLDQPSLVVRSELLIGAECGGLNTIRGKIKSAPVDRELWIKVIPIFGTGGTESRVASSGDFEISGLDYGHYVLVVMDGDKAIHTETIVVRGENKALSIEL
jgi:hypothetical protein